ncbi:LysR family transcriptional regulator [Cribrihabitans neustonicus]|uniref:LysR family transcriptional regulator n=1 Tax=Cribrihabitans neustonicus TaxID=1429085 RepID=UPI003B5C3E70
MQGLPNLVWLRAFESAARLQSFTAAAAELGLTQAAVSHQVRSLEQSFGVSLFIRRPRHLELTDLGEAYYPAVAQALSGLAYSTRGLLGPGEARTVTLRAPVSTAVLCIAPALGAFHAAHPQIRIRLVSAVWAGSAQDAEVDVDLRLGPPGRYQRSAHLLSAERVIAVAAPEVAAGITGLDRLAAQTLIHIHGYQDHWLRLAQQEGLALADQAPPVSVDTSLAAIEIAAAGGGVAMLMRRYAALPLAQGRLAQVPGAEIPMGQGHYLLPAAAGAGSSPEAARVRDWVTGLFAKG